MAQVPINAQEQNRLRFALVGCGRIGNRHANHIVNAGTLVATCDVVPDRASALGDTHGAVSYSSIEAMLENAADIDVVSICTPNGLHAQHTISALKAGCHVLCEKPMAISVADCGEMIKTAERANRRLFVVKQNRFNPPVRAVKDAIEAGALGRIMSVQLNCFWNRDNDYYKDAWRGTKELDGGSLFTQFSHFVDLLYWLIGDVRDAAAITGNFMHEDVIEFEDTGVAAISFHNGAVGTINFTVNSFGKNMEGSLTVFGEKGTVKIGGQYLNELEYANVKDYSFGDLPAGNTPNNYGSYVGSMSNHGEVYQNVVDVLRNEGVITTSAFEGLKTVEIIDKIYAAARRWQS